MQSWCTHRSYCTILLYLSKQCTLYISNIWCLTNFCMCLYLYIILRVFIIIIIISAKSYSINCMETCNFFSLVISCGSPLDEIFFYPENGGKNCLRNVDKGLPEQTWRITTQSILIYTHLFHIRTSKLGNALFLKARMTQSHTKKTVSLKGKLQSN